MTCAHGLVGDREAEVALLAPDPVPAGPGAAGQGRLVPPVRTVRQPVAHLGHGLAGHRSHRISFGAIKGVKQKIKCGYLPLG